MRVERLLFIGILLAGILGGCAPPVHEGEFLCSAEQPGSCPAGWACQCRGTACEWRCYQEGGGFCGNGALDPGEECDGSQFGGNTCQSLGRGDGTAVCRPDCTIYCTDCGDGKVEGEEGCDEGSLNSDGPNASCRTDCRLRQCGDGIVDDEFDEECDGAVPAGVTCLSLGFYEGELSCTSLCQLDVRQCQGRCGDGFRTGDEACDGADFGGATCGDYGFYTGSLACSGDCQTVNTAGCSQRCGDGELNGNEECDGDKFGNESCVTKGFYQGTLACASDCTIVTAGCSERCGDGLKNGTEACDDQDFGDRTCQSYGYYQGSLTCKYECRQISIENCSEHCGDGIKNGDEECDGEDFGVDSCMTPARGYYSGNLTCLASCKVSEADCSGRCGDLTKNGTEVCDGLDFGGTTCVDYQSPGYGKYYSGHLTCENQCTSIVPHCTEWCGDGARNGTEKCDPGHQGVSPDLGGANCQAFKFYGGPLACAQSCNGFDTSGCRGYCGDGTINGLEDCDGLEQGSATCLEHTGAAGGSPSCTASCTRSYATCFYPGWRAQSSPTFENLNAVAGLAPNNVWAVGDHGTVLRFDGTQWKDDGIEGAGNLTAIGFREGKTYVAGAAGVVYIDGGGVWVALNASEPKPDITGLWLPPAVQGEIWLTTLSGEVWRMNPAGGWILEFTAPTLPPPHGKAEFHAILGAGATADSPIVVVGSNGSIWRRKATLWGQEGIGVTGATLRGLWGQEKGMTVVGDAATVLVFDGASWLPPPNDSAGNLAAIHGIQNKLAFAVGQEGLMIQLDANAWGGVTPVVGADLRGVWLASESDGWAVGTAGALVRFSGDAWRGLRSAVAGEVVNAAFARTRDDVWLVGANGLSVHFDGKVWTQEATGALEALNGVWGGVKVTYAVGVAGRALVRNTSTGWEKGVLTGADLRAVAGLDDDYVVAVGDQGDVLLSTDKGVSWTRLEGTPNLTLHAAWVPQKDSIFIGGDDGYVARWNGTWNQLPPLPVGDGTPPAVRAIWGTDAADFWIGGSHAGVAYLAHWNGASWRVASLGGFDGTEITALAGRHSADVFAASPAGVLHFDGATWSPMVRWISARSLAVTPDAVFAVSPGGTVHRLTTLLPTPPGGPCTPPVPMYCGRNLEYRGSTIGQKSGITRYEPAGGTLEGREVCYRLESPVEGMIHLRLTPATADLDLVVIHQEAGALQCQPLGKAIDASTNPDLADEVIDLKAKEGLVYFVCVDAAKADDVSAYTLTVDCSR
jgi:hypothetical protein